VANAFEEVSVREAVPGDALGIAEVHVTTWKISYRGALPDTLLASLSVPPRAERWANMLAARVTTKQCILVAETRDGRVVGFASTGPQGSAAGSEAGDPAYGAEILCLYVLPSHQRMGIGKRLLRAVAKQLMDGGARSAFLWCLAEGPAVPFYEMAGGTRVRSKMESMGGTDVEVAGYGWTDLAPLAATNL